MAVHIDINVVFLDCTTTVFSSKYMSADDDFCSVRDYTRIHRNGLSLNDWGSVLKPQGGNCAVLP